MALLELTNQATAKTAIKSATDNLKTLLDQREAVWLKLPAEKQRAWLDSGKDPILAHAWAVYKELKDFFQGVDNG